MHLSLPGAPLKCFLFSKETKLVSTYRTKGMGEMGAAESCSLIWEVWKQMDVW